MTADDDSRATALARLAEACAGGDLLVAQNIVAANELTGEEVRADNNAVLWAAVDSDHKEVVEWLAATFALRALDIRSRGGECPAMLACMHGDLEGARWITATFAITTADMLENLYDLSCVFT
ncbi:MAG: hypothetical protein V4537_14065 [Pseudomonadota bacterium]